MSKTVCRITPYGGFDIPGLEGWLAALACKGLRYSATMGPLVCFDTVSYTHLTLPTNREV